MKNAWRLLDIFALVAIIGFTMAACDSDSGINDPFDGEWNGVDSIIGNEVVISISSGNTVGGGVYTMWWHDVRMPTVSYFAGTYTYSGNTAILTNYQDDVATATVSGNTMTIKYPVSGYPELEFVFTSHF